MLIHFENWTSTLTQSMVVNFGFPRPEYVIKAFAHAHKRNDLPIETHPDLITIPIDDAPLRPSEWFYYGTREFYQGSELEESIRAYGLPDHANEIIRALFRFANDWSIGRQAMEAVHDNSWLITHPLQIIGGIARAQQDSRFIPDIQLNIFSSESLRKLRHAIDYTDARYLLPAREGGTIRSQIETSTNHPERM
ncbi:MAG: hypothetical protein UV59_C0017G0042 [Candidatus Gottesmanbacteria bacterium GW2011_GWA1_43_11]|uniref:Uncharacterized protein n=1 Tax=Candidatus Gottesmanbacteria bacterium GW2011_GWA1_43_11 TaxID=1618436 RepID=A0A0G1CGK6_9BACT|nr:MAG: hypothetical protein UV59_C0017G0042 [Candidatus Gottesmanbacteria bacterium GW2011_GWA1_43_11]